MQETLQREDGLWVPAFHASVCGTSQYCPHQPGFLSSETEKRASGNPDQRVVYLVARKTGWIVDIYQYLH